MYILLSLSGLSDLAYMGETRRPVKTAVAFRSERPWIYKSVEVLLCRPTMILYPRTGSSSSSPPALPATPFFLHKLVYRSWNLADFNIYLRSITLLCSPHRIRKESYSVD